MNDKLPHTQETLVIKKPSEGLLQLVEKMRARKLSQQEKLRSKERCAMSFKV